MKKNQKVLIIGISLENSHKNHYMIKTATEPLLKDFMLDSTITAFEEVVKVTNKNESVFYNLKKSNVRDDLDQLFKEISGPDQTDLNQSQANIH